MENWPETLGYRIDFFTLFMILGIAQGVFLSAFFLCSKNLVHKYLGAILFAIAFMISEVFLCYSGVIVHIPHYVDLTEPFNFFVPAAIYLMIAAWVDQHPKNWYWHFLPFLFYLAYHFCFYLQNEPFKLNAFRDAYHGYLPELPFEQQYSADPWYIKKYVNGLSVLFYFLYVYPIYHLLKTYFNHKKINQQWFFAPERRWLFVFLGFKFFILILWLFKNILEIRDTWDNVGAALETLNIYVLNFFILKDGLLPIFKEKAIAKKYQKSSLSKSQMKRILEKLTNEMAINQPYLNPKLTLKILASTINVSPHHLSQVLNEELQQTYYEWIATYRVNAAKKILAAKEYNHYKLEEIGKLAGFNSRSVFYKAFKKIEGCSPSEFKEKL